MAQYDPDATNQYEIRDTANAVKRTVVAHAVYASAGSIVTFVRGMAIPDDPSVDQQVLVELVNLQTGWSVKQKAIG